MPASFRMLCDMERVRSREVTGGVSPLNQILNASPDPRLRAAIEGEPGSGGGAVMSQTEPSIRMTIKATRRDLGVGGRTARFNGLK